MTGGAPLRVLLAGGGSAGHIEPALALADALRRRDPATAVTALGTARGLETTLVPQRGYPLELVPAVPVPRRLNADLVTLPGRLWTAVRRVEEVLSGQQTDVLVGFGGYVAGPAYLAARRRHVPYVVHEANRRPGLANRLGARGAAYVASAASDSSLRGARYVGMPLRRSITSLDRGQCRAGARDHFGLDPDRPTLLAFGGSQGARRINQAVAGAATDLLAAGAQVLHVTGAGGGVDAGAASPDAGRYVVLEYCQRMDLAYAAADLVLARAGMTTVAELTAVGLPAAYVPLPIGNGEQMLNADPVVAAGGGILVEDSACTAMWVGSVLLTLLLDPPVLAQMGRAAASLGRRDGDEALADLVLLAARGAGP
jgi:UDP-N-acetylglucosamine--N-acetylmuramyl-(pentapeptide) pyrophosphoryl-undecaprenol N-acetylglucosamine transferase